LQKLDRERPVYVEAESRKIGNLHLPEAFIERIRAGECLNVDATLEARVEFLLKDHDYFLSLPDFLADRLNALQSMQSRETLTRWKNLIGEQQWPVLVRELLEQHYDPLYHRSQNHNFTGMAQRHNFDTDDLSPNGIRQLASRIIQSRTAQIA
jgi:tRNA 2-selenouridine synthase